MAIRRPVSDDALDTSGLSAATKSELTHEALTLCSQSVRCYWLARIDAFGQQVAEHVVARTPGLTDVTAEFTVKLLGVNRRRLLGVQRL